jgi:integrase
LENVRRTKDGLPPVLHLFPGYGDNDAQGDLKRTWRSICKSAGLSDLRFHDLRHSFASFLVSSGHNLPLIGQMLGHSNPSTTNRYSHLLLDPQREAAERIGAIVTGAGETAEVVPMARREA